MKRFYTVFASTLLSMILLLSACGQNTGQSGTTTPPTETATTAPAAPEEPEANDEEVSDTTKTDDVVQPGLGDQLVESIGEDAANHPLAPLFELQERFPTLAIGEGTPQEGGHLMVAVASDTPVQGIFNAVDYTGALDSAFMDWFIGGSVFSFTPARQFGQHGIVTWTSDQEEMSFTLTQVEEVYWHDGEPLTLDDLVFAIETIAHPLYDGMRWDWSTKNIKGAIEYNEGLADSISGLELSEDERELKIYFNEFPPSLLSAGFWSSPFPRHIFGDIPVNETSTHEATRVKPIGFGPFIVDSIVPGESMHVVANENYWLGKPHLDEVTLKVVPTEMVPVYMQDGQFDIADFRAEDYPDYENPTNYHYLGDITNTYDLIGFKIGNWNDETKMIEPNPNSKVTDRNLRLAMAHALDQQTLATAVYNGLRIPATSIIPPGHSAFIDMELPGYPYDPELSKQILDEAGYIDVDGDGIREDKEGNPFVLTYLVNATATNELVAQFYIQNWADVGLAVELYQGRLHDGAAVSENAWASDNWNDYDLIRAGWVAGFNPNPAQLWGDNTVNNRSRYITPELKQIMDNIGSNQAWDTEWLKQQYIDFQRAFHEEVVAVPTTWMMGLVAVNNRVHNYLLGTVLPEDGERTRGGLHRIQVTQDERFR